MQLNRPQQLTHQIAGFFSRPFPLLDDSKSKWFLIIFCGVFATFFIYFYNPFNLQQVRYDSAIGSYFSIWTAGIVGALILSFTQFPLRKITGLTSFTVGQFILWVLFEFLCLCCGMYVLFGESYVPFVEEFLSIVSYTLSLGILPYSLACLLIAVVKLSGKSKKGKVGGTGAKLCFRDESGKIKLAVRAEQVLFLRSEDNYTSIYYLQHGSVQRSLIRNNLKKLEEETNTVDLIRIHRSYMANLSNIISVERTKRGFDLIMEQMPGNPLSVTETYKDDFESAIQSGEPGIRFTPNE